LNESYETDDLNLDSMTHSLRESNALFLNEQNLGKSRKET